MDTVAQKTIEEIRRSRAELNILMRNRSLRYERLARDLEAKILQILQGGQYQMTVPEYNRLLREIGQLIKLGEDRFAKLSRAYTVEIANASVSVQARGIMTMLSGKRIEGVTSQRIKEVFDRFSGTDNRKMILRSSFQDWLDQWGENFGTHGKLNAAIRGTMTRGVAGGLTNSEMAKELIGPLGTVDIAGVPSPEEFAFRFARTQMGQLQNDLSVAVSRELGIGKYANIGLPTEAQSDECEEASQQPPMTMEEWNSWRASNGKGGPPKRHVFNCNCTLVGVPEFAEDEDWTQKNKAKEAARARKAEREKEKVAA